MLNVTLLCVGRCKEDYWNRACAEYQKRLGGFCSFHLIEVEECRCPDRPSPKEIQQVIGKEGERLLGRIPEGSAVVAMCIEGKTMSSEHLADYLQSLPVNGVSKVTFVIGGSFGLSDAVKTRADVRLSVSPMTFPHQLFRVMLMEQIYRGFQIAAGGKYHK